MWGVTKKSNTRQLTTELTHYIQSLHYIKQTFKCISILTACKSCVTCPFDHLIRSYSLGGFCACPCHLIKSAKCVWALRPFLNVIHSIFSPLCKKVVVTCVSRWIWTRTCQVWPLIQVTSLASAYFKCVYIYILNEYCLNKIKDYTNTL